MSGKPRRAKTVWTEPMIAVLRAEYPTTDDSEALAGRIGVTPKTLADKASNLGVKRLVNSTVKPKEGADGIVASALANLSELERAFR